MSHEPTYSPGDVIGGRYLVHRALAGGLGEVYLCLDQKAKVPVALKTFRQDRLSDIDHRSLPQQFEQEVTVWVALEKHPHIVRCFHMRRLDNRPYMVLEWVAGNPKYGTADLYGRLRYDPLPVRQALQLCLDICVGLAYAQEKVPGIVHRDLKPANVLVTQDGVAKITDWGLAKLIQEAGLEAMGEEGEAGSGAGHLSRTGGTPLYMAPEQWRGEELDGRTDLYGVGCLLYEMLMGSAPYVPASGASKDEMLQQLREQHFSAPFPALSSSLPEALQEIVACCLAKRRADRYGSVAELVEVLTKVYEEVAGQSPRVLPVGEEYGAGDYNNRGATYAELHQYERALEDYDLALQIDPNYAAAYSNRGKAYAELHQYDRALTDYDRALKINSNLADAYNNRGAAYAVLGKPERAVADYDRALAIDPNYATAYSNRGATYAGLHQYKRALADFDRALQIDPNEASAYCNRGVAYANQGKHDRALANFKCALDIDPNDAQAYSHRGSVYNTLEQYKRALADQTRALEIDPGLARAYFRRGNTYANLGEYGQALADYDRALQMDPNNAEAYFYKGYVLADRDRLQEALPCFEKASQLGYQQAAVAIAQLQRMLDGE